MSVATETEARQPGGVEQEILRGLLRGASAADIGWALAIPAEDVIDSARRSLVAFAPGLAAPLAPRELERVVDYVLLRQSPGQAAGTWELLQGSTDARRWAIWLRECLAELYGPEVPDIPGIPPLRSRGVVRGRRSKRAVRRRAAGSASGAQAAPAPARSLFRRQALAAFQKGQSEMRLPRFASAPVLRALWGLVSVILVAGGLATVVSVPTFASAVAVISAPPGSSAPPAGASHPLAAVLVIDPAHGSGLRPGAAVSVSLPGRRAALRTRVRAVAPGLLSPRQIVTRYHLFGRGADLVSVPSVVALVDISIPGAARSAGQYTGTVAVAHVRTGSRAVISLFGNAVKALFSPGIPSQGGAGA